MTSHIAFVNADNGHDRPVPREGRPPLTEPEEYMCLMRATCKSKKVSLSLNIFSPFYFCHIIVTKTPLILCRPYYLNFHPPLI